MRSDNDAERDRSSGGMDWLGRDAVPDSLSGSTFVSEARPSDGHHGRLLQAIHAELIPRLLGNRRSGVQVAQEQFRQQSRCVGAIDELAQLILRDDDTGAQALVDELLDAGVSIEQVFLDVLSPAAQRLGAMWESDTCSFADVTLGLWRIQKLLFDLSARFRSDSPTEVDPAIDGRQILLAAAPGGQHNFGISMLGEFFARAGWAVETLTEPTQAELISAVRARWFDVLGLSVGSEVQIAGLTSAIVALRRASRNQKLIVMVGGAAFAHHPEYVALVGADCMGSDARAALSAAADRVLAQEHRC
jgi:MerR family transcriptional regulator, light-induced transcriptional regulator